MSDDNKICPITITITEDSGLSYRGWKTEGADRVEGWEFL